jgi:hypothetical protein
MNVENILNNNELKTLFLKSLILGINYGKSDNANYYLENIVKEMSKIPNDNRKINLENKRIYTINLIKSLSKNYNHNQQKINILKYNLNIINNELKKYNNSI